MVSRGRPGEREITREKVLVAAERLFLTRGFLAVTIEDIAAKAGFTRGAVYSSFAGKEDLFLALAERRAERQLDDTRKALADATSDHARLDVFGRLLAREVERSRDWARAEREFLAVAADHEVFGARITAGERAGRDALVAMLRDLCTSLGVEPPPDLDDFAVAVRALARGLMAEWHVDPTIDVGGIFARSFTLLIQPQMPTGPAVQRAHSEASGD